MTEMKATRATITLGTKLLDGFMLPDGSYQLEVPYGEDWELVQDILRQGSDVEVIAPAGLRDKVRGVIERMRERYK